MTAFGDEVLLLRRNVWRYFEGMSDEEAHWEPAPGMWGVRRRSELRTPVRPGAPPGEFWVDFTRPPPDPEPFTTAAWRVAHLIYATWDWISTIAQQPTPPEPELPGSASGLVSLWKEVLDHYVDVVTGFAEDDFRLDIPVGDRTRPRSGVVSHVTLEIAFHSSEVGTMRHLYRATAGKALA